METAYIERAFYKAIFVGVILGGLCKFILGGLIGFISGVVIGLITVFLVFIFLLRGTGSTDD